MRNNVALLCLLTLGCDRIRDPKTHGYQGVVEFEERRVSFEFAGRIEVLAPTRGATLHAGEVVATLDQSAATPLRDARRAEVDGARARLALLRAGARSSDLRAASAQVAALDAVVSSISRSLARAESLARSGAGPSAAVDDLQGQRERAVAERSAAEERLRTMRQGARPQEVSTAEAQLRAAEHALAGEEQRLSRFTARAPIDGVVLDRLAEPGDVVSAGAPVITLADTARPYVDVFVPQGVVGRVRLGAGAEVRVDGHASALPARVEDIARETEFTPRFLFSERERPNLVVRVRLRVDDPRRVLRAGTPAFATIAGASP